MSDQPKDKKTGGRPRPIGNAARLIPAAGMTLWLIVQGALAMGPLWSRALPPEVDDFYGYLVKAPEISSCFLQDCPSLEDLRAQVTAPSDSLELILRRMRIHHRILNQYSMAHSLLLLGARSLGLSWVLAYKVVATLGWLVIGFGAFAFLRALWGAQAAGVAMGFLAFVAFSDQGLHYLVPSNIAAGAALLLWSLAVSRPARLGAPFAIVLVVLPWIHTIGVLYGWLALALFLVAHGARRAWERRGALAAAALYLLVCTALPLVVSRPAMRHQSANPDFGFAEWQEAFGAALGVMSREISRWTTPLGTLPVVAALCVLGAWAAWRSGKKTAVRVAAVLGAAVACGSLYVMPVYGPVLFPRIFIPFAICLTGAAAWAIVFLAARIRSLLPNHRAAAAAMACLLAIYALRAARVGSQQMFGEIRHMKSRQSFQTDPAQPALLASLALPGERVLYLDEIGMPFYLTYGCFDIGAVYVPALGTPAERETWLNGSRLRFAVVPSPLRASRALVDGRIPLAEIARLEARPAGTASIREMRLHIENGGGVTAMEAALLDARGEPSGSVSGSVPAGFTGWSVLQVPPGVEAAKAVVTFPAASERLFLSGFRFGPGELFWPWEEGALLRVVPSREAASDLLFDIDEKVPADLDRSGLRVLADRGATCLVEILREP